MISRSAAAHRELARRLVGVLMILAGLAAPARAQTGPSAPAAPGVDEQALAIVARINRAVIDRKPDLLLTAMTELDPSYTRLSPKLLKKVNKAMLGMFMDFRPREVRDIESEPPMPGVFER